MSENIKSKHVDYLERGLGLEKNVILHVCSQSFLNLALPGASKRIIPCVYGNVAQGTPTSSSGT